MRRMGFIVGWVLAGLLGAGLLLYSYPRALPFWSSAWDLSPRQVEALALRRLRVLGDPVPHAYVVTVPAAHSELERTLQLAADLPGVPASRMSIAELRRTGLPDRLGWEVLVYPPDRGHDDWTYRARLTRRGEVIGLSLRLDPDVKGVSLPPAEALRRADAFLRQQGIDPTRFEAPQVRSRQLAERTDLAVRYAERRRLPGGATFGVEVAFAGARLAGFDPWLDDPAKREVQRSLRPVQFASFGHLVLIYLLVGVTAVPFLRRYHEGLIGVTRGLQIFALVEAAGICCILVTARASSQGIGFGVATRQQTTWFYAVVGIIFYVLPAAVLAMLAWSVGESALRERWGQKLAAFDALFQRRWANATVACSSLAGVMAGVLGAGLMSALYLPLRRFGVWPLGSAGNWASAWPGLETLSDFLCFILPFYLLTALCVLPFAARWWGRRPGIAAAVLVGAVLLPVPFVTVPVAWALGVTAVFAALAVALFIYSDLLALLLAGLVSYLLLHAGPLLGSANLSLRANTVAALALAALPLLLSVRWLTSGREFTYRYEDIPPHVRRIAERERQRVELETARRIQSSILPELPASLAGVALAHAYLPASEVGGDFYDVLALEDGRLAVAVGDVAGHGVSSGLVMSMAKSALAVQVTFNPDVAAVFATLNRIVYQSARKRLLTTLCYAVLDPERRELFFASAGHLFPYRIKAGGQVEALESVGYPLGVRPLLDVHPRTARLDPGDSIFLFSDGLVEARSAGGDDLFGFERLEQSLSRHARGSVEQLRDGVLADVGRWSGPGPREDDQTIVVLRLPVPVM